MHGVLEVKGQRPLHGTTRESTLQEADSRREDGEGRNEDGQVGDNLLWEMASL